MHSKLTGTLLIPKLPDSLRGSLLHNTLRGSLLKQKTVLPKIDKILSTDYKLIENNKEYIEELKKKYSEYSLSDLLGGETELNHENGENIFVFSKKEKVLFVYKNIDLFLKKSICKFINTGVDYTQLHKELPNERYKFYFSLDLSTDYKKEKSEEFFSGNN